MPDLVDVIEVEIAEPRRVRVFAESKTPDHADAIVQMAILRRGVSSHFYTTCAPRSHRDGDVWQPKGE